ncbi:MAG: hypothetical protein HZB26_09140 [Candidatus Hydrogenedentes bacterium]|nr:hypothetical protein [Candidatus Hydrogenedentota bacterium]
MNAARGALDESISDLAAIMEFSDAYAAGTKPFDRFVRNAIEERVFNTTPVVFGADTVTEAQINEIAAQLPRSYAREAFAHSLSNETSEVLEELDRMRETGEGAEGMIQGARLGAFAGSYASGRPMPGEFEFFLQSVEYRLYASPLGRPWQNLDEQAYADSMGHVIEAAALPFYQAVPDPAAFDQDNGGGLGGFSNVRASRTLAVQATYEAKLDLTRMGLMLQRYRVQYGAYPISLDAIATDMGGALPLDPFSGASYIYRPSGDSFLLYSVGYNRQDDGGTEGLHYDGDIVWRGGRALRSSDGVEP